MIIIGSCTPHPNHILIAPRLLCSLKECCAGPKGGVAIAEVLRVNMTIVNFE